MGRAEGRDNVNDHAAAVSYEDAEDSDDDPDEAQARALLAVMKRRTRRTLDALLATED